MDVRVPPVRAHERGHVLRDGAARDQGGARARPGHVAVSATEETSSSGGNPRFPMNRSLKSSIPDSSMY